MSDINNDYNFDSYINWRLNIDYYDDDSFLKKSLKYFADNDWQKANQKAMTVSPRVSITWRVLSERSAGIDKRPRLDHYDAFNQRVDQIIRCAETERLEKEIFSLGLFSSRTGPWERFIQLLLIYENGESCISCPLVCTEGLAALLDEYADTPELKRIRDHLREGIDGRYAIASQFITEIQGGSDIAANRVMAVRKDDHWRLYGKKFFCSAIHADYFLVTARPENQKAIAAFVVPAWHVDNGESGLRNFYRIDRLKPKLGTCELPTAEVSFNGAIAYPVAPLDRGISSVVAIVLSYSRLTVGLFSAAIMLRAAREARNYAEFREAFGRPIAEFPLLAGQLDRLQQSAEETAAGIFKIYRHLLSMPTGLAVIDESTLTAEQKCRAFELRELIMLQKIVAATDCTEMLHKAISVFGGHGVIEDFSSLPRLLRDSMVNELWEGPRNVLLTQMYRDFQKALSWYPADRFVDNLLSGNDSFKRKQLGRDMLRLVASPPDETVTESSIEQWQEWEQCCIDLMHAYQQQAWLEVENAS